VRFGDALVTAEWGLGLGGLGERHKRLHTSGPKGYSRSNLKGPGRSVGASGC
jgi:hypothetical protein